MDLHKLYLVLKSFPISVALSVTVALWIKYFVRHLEFAIERIVFTLSAIAECSFCWEHYFHNSRVEVVCNDYLRLVQNSVGSYS